MKALFIHRSVGKHLMHYGKLRFRLNAKNIEIDDYNNNTGTLTHNDGRSEISTTLIPGNDTTPSNLDDLFKKWNKTLNDYDLIIIKSCYPNSRIKDKEQLEQIKGHYQNIIKACAAQNIRLLILTTPPLRPSSTNNTEVKFADALATWLMRQANNNSQVFNFRKLLTNNRGMLKASYRHWSIPWDNHPKAKAHRVISPLLVKYIASIYSVPQ